MLISIMQISIARQLHISLTGIRFTFLQNEHFILVIYLFNSSYLSIHS